MADDGGPSRLAVRQAVLMVGGVALFTLLLFVVDNGAKWFALAFSAVIVYICIDGLRRNRNR